ncbi:hypothetical protein TNCV_4197981 [Trichonephila clavipes]|nr:hypothetical protein TNCV_4197981 [Trichonephila clavipes]
MPAMIRYLDHWATISPSSNGKKCLNTTLRFVDVSFKSGLVAFWSSWLANKIQSLVEKKLIKGIKVLHILASTQNGDGSIQKLEQ